MMTGGGHVGRRLRIGALGATALAVAFYSLAGTAGVGYATAPNPSGSPSATSSSDATPSPSSSSSTSESASATPTSTATASPTASTQSGSGTPAPTATAPSTARRTGTGPTARAHRRASRLAAGTVTASPYLVMTASTLDAVGLAYVGTFSVPGSSGNMQVLRFTMTSGSVTDVSFTQACAGGRTTVTSAPSAALGNTTFDAVSLAVTVGATPITFTITNPPTTAFPSEIVLQDMTLTATTVAADQLSAPSFSTQAATC